MSGLAWQAGFLLANVCVSVSLALKDTAVFKQSLQTRLRESTKESSLFTALTLTMMG